MHATCIVWRGRERASRGQVPPANKHPSGRAAAAAAVGPPMCSAGQGLFVGGRCGSTIFVLAILLCEVPDASRGTGEHHRHAPHARGNRAMVASLGLAKINWVPCPAVGPMGVPIRGV